MRNRILDASEELFAAKGYDRTSTRDIMEKAGIARGTLYNHFPSKEALLDAVIERMVERTVEKAGTAAEGDGEDTLTKLTKVLDALTVKDGREGAMLNELHKAQNALMHQKSRVLMLERVVPLITDIVKEGVEEGIFRTPYPMEAVEMILVYSSVALDDSEPGFKEKTRRGSGAFVHNVECLLGARDGALREVLLPLLG